MQLISENPFYTYSIQIKSLLKKMFNLVTADCFNRKNNTNNGDDENNNENSTAIAAVAQQQ